MAKLTVGEPIKPVITKAKNKRKAKNNKAKLNEVKVEAIKNAVLTDKNTANENKNAVKLEIEDIKTKKESKSPKNEAVSPSKVVKRKNKKGPKSPKAEGGDEVKKENSAPHKNVKKVSPNVPADFAEKYPIFKNEDLVTRFLSVTMTNNQKGRIRQLYRENFKGTSDSALPDIIHDKLKSLVKDTENISDGSLRKIRILYNMLKQTFQSESNDVNEVTKKKNKNKKAKTDLQNGDAKENGETSVATKESKEKKPVGKKEKDDEGTKSDVKHENSKKTKGPKRYVVFVGNLPLDIDREKIMEHFSDLKDHIVDVRIPKVVEGKKSAIAYVELKNEPSYELALSKHHSMLSNKRINVLYSVQQNSKISKTEAKGKAAKLVALQKSGKLTGSVPLNKKRSQRRAKAKKAQAQAD